MHLYNQFFIRVSFLTLCLLNAGILSSASAPAFAQAAFPDDILRIRPKLADIKSDKGIRAGTFYMSPAMGLKTTYDDNVLRTSSNPSSDFITEVKPKLAVQSNWNRHALFASIDGNFGSYKSDTLSNYKDYNFMVSGRYDITYETYLSAGLLQNKKHLGLGLSDDPGTSRQGSATTQAGELGFVRTLGAIWLKVFGRKEKTEYAFDAQNAGSNEYRKRDTKNMEAFLAYETMPGNNVFINTSYDISDYNLVSGGMRQATGLDIRGGLNFDTKALWKGSVFGGYLRRNHNDTMKDSKSTYIGGNVRWNMTELTQLSFSLDHAFVESLTAGTGGIFQTQYELKLDNDFTQKTRGNVFLGTDDNDYIVQTGAQDRNNQLYYTGVEGIYNPSDKLALRLRYDLKKRFSDRAGDEYLNNQLFLSLTYDY